MKEIGSRITVGGMKIKDAINLVLELRELKKEMNRETKEIKKYKPRSKKFIK
tara:strand:- start:254 stop:409 length:156 start_codon:yes stop_codon:yes gene_type:complete